MESVIVVDLEGTLSDSSHRNNGLFDHDFPHEWHMGFIADPVHTPMKQLLEYSPFEYIVLSSKPELYRVHIEDWLETNMDKLPIATYLRPNDNIDTSPVLKKKILEEEILPKFKVVLAIDDRADICRMYSQLHIYSLHFRGGKVWSLTRF